MTMKTIDGYECRVKGQWYRNDKTVELEAFKTCTICPFSEACGLVKTNSFWSDSVIVKSCPYIGEICRLIRVGLWKKFSKVSIYFGDDGVCIQVDGRRCHDEG